MKKIYSYLSTGVIVLLFIVILVLLSFPIEEVGTKGVTEYQPYYYLGQGSKFVNTEVGDYDGGVIEYKIVEVEGKKIILFISKFELGLAAVVLED
tara:strand:+ start:514 stop:798 length:285 start_codon:yes stop_codon:yes gene_type:complete